MRRRSGDAASRWRHKTLTGLWVTLAVATSSTAVAQTTDEPADALAHPSQELDPVDNYQRSVVVSDLVAGGFVVTGTALALVCVGITLDLNDDDIDRPDNHPTCPMAIGSFAAAAATYTLSPAVIHLLHKNPNSAGLSLGTRVGLPVAGVALGYGLAGGSNSSSLPSYGLVAGVAGAMALDWLVLSQRQLPTAPDHSAAILVAPTRGGVSLAVGGAF